MASGTTISPPGGTVMTQVVAGTDLISAADFNAPRANIDALMKAATTAPIGGGVFDSTIGWNQGGAGVAAASAGSTVQDTGPGGFKDMQDDVQAMCAFLGITVRAGVGSDVTTSTTISAATWNNLMLNINECRINRFSPASRTASTDGATSRTAAWTNTLTQETTWTFANHQDIRAFFNGGGALGVSASRSGGSAHTQNTQWTNKLSAVSDCWIYAGTTTASAGTSAGLGFYDLGSAYQQVLIYYGGASPYTSDYVKVEAKVNITTEPTVLTIKITMVDAGDNVLDESVDGTLTVNARRNHPNASGSGFTFPVATDGVGAISGS